MKEFELLEELAKAGGSITYIGEQRRNEIKNLPLPDKEELRLQGEIVISKKLQEFDNLIIEASAQNLRNAMNSMEPANILLAKYARSLLEQQRKEFMRLTDTEEANKSPINLDFLNDKNLKAKNITVEIKNTQINTTKRGRGRPRTKPVREKVAPDTPHNAEGWQALNSERDQKIIEMANQGYTYRAIAKELHVSLGSICRTLQSQELK